MSARTLGLTAAALVAAWCAVAAEAPPAAKAPRDAQDFVLFGETRPVLVRLHVRVDGKPVQHVWQENIDHLFRSLDTDHDGVLSKKEAEQAPSPEMLFGSGGFVIRGPAPAMPQFNANRDGKVTLAEFADYYRRNGAPPLRVVAGQQANVQVRLFAANTGRLIGGPPSAEALDAALFKALDADGDGKLSRAELAAASQVLQKLDLDDDEMITVPELLPNSDGGGRFTFFVLADGSPSQAAPTAGILLPITPGESPAPLVRELQTRYGSKATGPARKMTRQELGLDGATFRRLDMNGDGVLDGDELARFADRPPDLELTCRLGKDGPGEMEVQAGPTGGQASGVAAAVRRGGERNLLLDLGNVRLDLRAVGQVMRGPRVVQPLRQRYLAQFKAADRDNNGYLDEQEAMASPFFRGMFKMMDSDGDGKLFEKEMLAFLDRVLELQLRAQSSCASVNVGENGQGLFDLIDTDHDGRLSVRELRNAAKLVGQLDRDGDGCLSRNEIPRNYQITVQLGTGGNGFAPGVRFARRVALGGFPQPGQRPAAGPVWFRKMDRNHDGDVSRREWLGTEEEFNRIDTDGDGLISLEEAERADALLRKEKPPGR
jgi:Ca2+-binding EF-hand superfamily protein